MDVRYLKVLLLFMTECHTLSAVIATTCQPQGDAYKIIAYKKRTQQSDISECTLYTTNTDQDEVKCGRKCKQPEYSCLFYTLQDEACSLCIFVVSGFTSDELTLANFTLAANAVIYQKENMPAVYQCTEEASSTQHISAGTIGVWKTDTSHQIHFRQNNTWTHVPGVMFILDVGSKVCGISSGQGIYCKLATDSGWTHLAGALNNIDVSKNGQIWGDDSYSHTYSRTHTDLLGFGQGWDRLGDGSELPLGKVTVGGAGVWAISTSQLIYYRVGTYGDTGVSGTSWELVAGSAIYIDSGDNYVWICTSENQVFRRHVSADNPTGSSWVIVHGLNYKQISAQSDTRVWGVNSEHVAVACRAQEDCVWSSGVYGGMTGSEFSDQNITKHGDITAIHINDQFCVGFTYGVSHQGPCHGSDNGTVNTVTLNQGEYIRAVHGTYSATSVSQLKFITNTRTLDLYGSAVGDQNIDVDSDGRKLAYISGKSGSILNQLILHFTCP